MLQSAVPPKTQAPAIASKAEATAVMIEIRDLMIVLSEIVLLPDQALSRFLGCRAMVALGTISYGLYLWHFPMMRLVDDATAWWPLRWIVCFVAAPVIAYLSWRFVERPALALAAWLPISRPPLSSRLSTQKGTD